MLQPDQLKAVGATRPNEVDALRAFLASVGLVLDEPATLHRLATRLESDASFHRDLSLHTLAVLHDMPDIQAADMLGMLAVAAAGPQIAASTNEQDALKLLRFILIVHTIARGQQNSPVAAQTRKPGAALPLVRSSSLQPAAEVRKFGSRTWPIMAAIACALVTALFAGWLYHRRFSPQPLIAPRAINSDRTPPTSRIPSQAAQAVLQPRAVAAPVRTSATAATNRKAASVAESALTGRAEIPFPVTALPKSSDKDVPSKDTSTLGKLPLERSGPLTRENTPVASDVLSERLGARALPTDAPGYEAGDGRSYPRLLRRHPLLPLAGPEAPLVASNGHPALPGSAGAAAMAAVVRPVSLGTMAANVLYSPAPAYPPEAAAARIQGAVKVQAEVDRDGNVASARVISGPPLLRDAAVDAVQRWRYRPYVVGGRAVSASATAMVEFELQ